MKKRTKYTVLTTGIIVALPIAWFVFCPANFYQKDVDSTLLTKWSLQAIGVEVERYLIVSEPGNLESLHKVETMNHLWSLLRHKIDPLNNKPIMPARPDKRYSSDGWDNPFKIEVKSHPNGIVVKVLSDHAESESRADLYIEIVLKDRTVYAKPSWKP